MIWINIEVVHASDAMIRYWILRYLSAWIGQYFGQYIPQSVVSLISWLVCLKSWSISQLVGWLVDHQTSPSSLSFLLSSYVYAVTSHDQNVFNFNADGRPCNGFPEALLRYRQVAANTKLAGENNRPLTDCQAWNSNEGCPQVAFRLWCVGRHSW